MTGPLQVRNGIFESNCYVCPTSVPGECFVVDPGLDDAVIQDALAEAGLRPVAVLCTHGHFDHVGGAGEMQRRYGIPVYLHRQDERTAGTSNFLMMAFKVPGRITLPSFHLVDAGARTLVGGDEVEWLHVPGHTPGSCVLLHRGSAYTGDTLYRDSVGLVSLPGEDKVALRRSLEALWNSLPTETLVRPGHGGVASFGDIKLNNAALRRFLDIEA